jgi:SAM-dependent methyltransferase
VVYDSSMSGVERRVVDDGEASAASRSWWDSDAAAYQQEHSGFLGSGSPLPETGFVWSPEGLAEPAAGLLGDVRGEVVLEVGCGGGQCTRWLHAVAGARVVGLDVSAGMLREARHRDGISGVRPPYVQADAIRLPVRSASVDLACSAFGAVPFVADPAAVMGEVARVLRPGGRWIFSVTHPMRWCFPDDPGPAGLTVFTSYFDRRAYVEVDADERPVYVETHRTMGDRVRELLAAGLQLVDLVEPEWVDEVSQPWGQWGALRGHLFPGTAIFVSRKPA